MAVRNVRNRAFREGKDAVIVEMNYCAMMNLWNKNIKKVQNQQNLCTKPVLTWPANLRSGNTTWVLTGTFLRHFWQLRQFHIVKISSCVHLVT